MFKVKGLLVDDALGLEVVEPYTIDSIFRFSSSLGVSATGIKQDDKDGDRACFQTFLLFPELCLRFSHQFPDMQKLEGRNSPK